jgi:C-terminal processing protease CtpA/Prc
MHHTNIYWNNKTYSLSASMFITSTDQITRGTLLLVDWDMKLQQTMVEMFPLNSADAAYTKISGMLSTLGDPFTRIISPKVL